MYRAFQEQWEESVIAGSRPAQGLTLAAVT